MSLQVLVHSLPFPILRHEQVHGGDINRAYCLYGEQRKYFLKLNHAARYPFMFEKESKGLDTLRNNCSLMIPGVIKTGIAGDEQYLLLEWMEKGAMQRNFWEDFGRKLAMLHKRPQAYFGWEEDNYIGSLPQQNARHEAWHTFYAECRILPLVHLLYESGVFTKDDMSLAQIVCEKLDKLFPLEHPSLLHGDLWSGNFMVAENGNAAVYDPAVYYGHREMDLGMTLLFGGFDDRFYNAYQEVYPLEKEWKQRVALTQLYPLLAHAVLFGGSYAASVKNNLKIYQ